MSASDIKPRAPSFTGKYLNLTTFRQDGTAVATPVWFVTEEGKLFVVTGNETYKVARIRRNPAVTVADCTASGRLRSASAPGHARVLAHAEAPHVERLMARKYRIDRVLILPVYHAVQTIRRGRRDGSDSVILAITRVDAP